MKFNFETEFSCWVHESNHLFLTADVYPLPTSRGYWVEAAEVINANLRLWDWAAPTVKPFDLQFKYNKEQIWVHQSLLDSVTSWPPHLVFKEKAYPDLVRLYRFDIEEFYSENTN